MYLPRAIQPLLSKAAAGFPAVLLTGARQTGKTTLLRHLFGKSHGYVSFDLPEVEDLATADPNLFLDRNPPPVILDEVQRVPHLFRYLKERIDRRRRDPGQYLLTGSQAFPMMAGVTESLAGRVAILELSTLSLAEQDGLGTTWPIPPTPVRRGDADSSRVAEAMIRGGYPELWGPQSFDTHLWFESYVQTYLERDVRQVRQVGDLRDFRRLMVALAARAGQLLSLSELARDLGVAVNTVKAWVSVLEASHQIHVLQPFHRNLTKRLVKTPKVYFDDTGLLCHLLGLRGEDAVLSSAVGGPVFENLVFGELLRALQARGRAVDVTFFRASDGLEVDFLLEDNRKLFPIEVKRSATARPEMADGIEKLRALLGKDLGPGLVVMLPTREVSPLSRSCDAAGINWIAGR